MESPRRDDFAATTEYPRGSRDSSAPSTLATTEYPRGSRGVAAIRPHRFHQGLFRKRALYVANAGLWHVICRRGARPGDDCLDKNYAAHVEELLRVLTNRAEGEVVWRHTTAVHREL